MGQKREGSDYLMIKTETKPEDCFMNGMMFAREITDAYYQKYGHIKIGNFTLHHYLLLLTVPLVEDECMQAFLAGVALDDLPDLLDDIFQNSELVHEITDSMRESRGENKKQLY